MPRRSRVRDVPPITKALAQAVAVPSGSAGAADAECRKLLASLRARCPGLLPAQQLTPGQVGPEIPLETRAGVNLLVLVARELVGLATDKQDAPSMVVLTKGADELAIDLAKISVTTAPGAIGIALPVRCDQTGEALVRVRFALGSDARPAGMLASTDERPFGPPAIVDAWGEALTAFAWQMLLTVTTKLAGAAGQDADGAGLIPAAIKATDTGLAVLTMARHPFDRVLPA
jgi:hypothetical protein